MDAADPAVDRRAGGVAREDGGALGRERVRALDERRQVARQREDGVVAEPGRVLVRGDGGEQAGGRERAGLERLEDLPLGPAEPGADVGELLEQSPERRGCRARRAGPVSAGRRTPRRPAPPARGRRRPRAGRPAVDGAGTRGTPGRCVPPPGPRPGRAATSRRGPPRTTAPAPHPAARRPGARRARETSPARPPRWARRRPTSGRRDGGRARARARPGRALRAPARRAGPRARPARRPGPRRRRRARGRPRRRS